MITEVQRLTLHDSLDAAIARATVRKLAASFGYSLIDQGRIAAMISEIAHDLVTYAGQGEIVISWQEDNGPKGLAFFCHDQGLAAAELTTVLQTGGAKTQDKLNLLGLRKLADEFKVTIDPKYGNCVSAIIWQERTRQ
ncbi:MAG: hypothetical protein AB1801_09845 [Chloroflexota bacterium]